MLSNCKDIRDSSKSTKHLILICWFLGHGIALMKNDIVLQEVKIVFYYLLVHHQCKSRPLTRNSLVCWSIITCILIKLVEAFCLLIQRNQNLKLDEEKRFLYVLFVVPAFVWNNTRFSFWKIHYNKTRLILFLLFDEFNTKVRYHNPHGS